MSESSPRRAARPRLPRALRGLPAEFGGHTRKLLRCDLLVVSPGVDWELPILREARARKIPVWSELELGWRLIPMPETAAVTGTNGKTTTVSLLGDILRRAGRGPMVGGNTGRPLCDFFGRNSRNRSAVLEASSYQLEGIRFFHPSVSAILNVTPDHLHRHGSMRDYAASKSRIFMNQGAKDVCVLNADDPWCRRISKTCGARPVWFSSGRGLAAGAVIRRSKRKIAVRLDRADPWTLYPFPERLPGLHNAENACAAILCALALGVGKGPILESLERFRGVEHRMESLGRVRGVSFVNDSKATNVDSTVRALESVGKGVWLILGGQDKGAPYAPLAALVRGKVKGILLIGEAAGRIRSELGKAAPAVSAGTLQAAVKEAFRKAGPGDTVLLSPACASFDQFRDFEERGRRFKDLVRRLRP